MATRSGGLDFDDQSLSSRPKSRLDLRWLRMRAVLDINVPIALLDSDHSLHIPATTWFDQHARSEWASCPITQNGCVRIMSNPNYAGALPAQAVVERLAAACRTQLHEFWLDDISLLDGALMHRASTDLARSLTRICWLWP